ncbi:uncharacterized protein LOC128132965 [Lactuca sativa]|uniref:uncharacterized protein LOC128132965 n=1 Tax=Lactuca sativa TaxID=4236 RepID=UPI0022AFA8B9|nr:uncharacterized protein LOC128132965 [Lactuca sativa]
MYPPNSNLNQPSLCFVRFWRPRTSCDEVKEGCCLLKFSYHRRRRKGEKLVPSSSSLSSGIYHLAVEVESAGLQQCGVESAGLQQCEVLARTMGRRRRDLYTLMGDL